jgi:aspartate-semialdehyde dehydrogenase
LTRPHFRCSTKETLQGQLDQVGDEVTFIQAISADAFDGADFTFFCGSESLTRRHWQQALRAGSTVLDLSAALDREPGVVIRAPWLGSEAAAVDLFTPAVVPAHPAVIAVALLLQRLQQAARCVLPQPRFWSRPANSAAPPWMSCISRRSACSAFQSLPRAFYDAQAAYNLLAGMGESSKVSLPDVEARIRRHYEALTGGRGPSLALQVIHAPVFHGHTFSIAVELERPVECCRSRRGFDGRACRAGAGRH